VACAAAPFTPEPESEQTMAGIGYELRKLLQRDSLLSVMRAYLYAGVISSGPWVLSIVGMLAHS